MLLILVSLFWLIIISFIVIRNWLNKKSDSIRCLTGKTALVTGGNAGIGYNVSLLLASRGCRVIIADRDNGYKTVEDIKQKTGNPNVEYKKFDLSSLKSVREFARDICKNEEQIDILCNNAGIGLSHLKSEDGLNMLMQINYLAPVLLTYLLLEPLKASKNARIVFASSMLAFWNNLSLKKLNYPYPIAENDRVTMGLIYGSSKALNILAARKLAPKLEKYGITVNAADPGYVNTSIFDKVFAIANPFDYFMMLLGNIFIARSAFDGAQTMFHVASSEKLEGVSGHNFMNCRKYFIPRFLKNKTYCDELWKATNQLIGWEKEDL